MALATLPGRYEPYWELSLLELIRATLRCTETVALTQTTRRVLSMLPERQNSRGQFDEQHVGARAGTENG